MERGEEVRTDLAYTCPDKKWGDSRLGPEAVSDMPFGYMAR